MNSFIDVSIGKQKIKNIEILFSNTKICKNHEGSFNLGKTWSFFFHQFFAKPVACNEAPKKQTISRKNEKNSKSRRLM